MNYTRHIHNVSGSQKTYRGVPIANGAFYEIEAANLVWYMTSDEVMADLGSGDIRMSADGSTDYSTSVAENIRFLLGDQAIDPDTGAPVVSTKKLKPNFYFQVREIEWETSKLSSVHDKDLDQTDLGQTTIAFFDANRTELVSPSQATLDAQCRYTRVRFNPGVDWGVRGILIGHSTALTSSQNLYVYANVSILVDPAPVYLELPQADGGLNMYFVGAHKDVGVDEENFTYFTENDFVDFWCYHDVGFNHRMQGKFKIALPIS